ncbi:MAG: flavodoxin-dependent (E)-4-hydroxy-3-methylbut-2-enyl-diphosphate synthase [Candidatus Bipolaricaulota bacterium]|nr:flavodoxin-dependent (E)-4-hydroxy-3-methylbut-2-enyl-diphosphate synthase [Candidatus Bipolaricaulota bacterium]MBS3791742.1 flavodoxin-dependent (E)-4-hydroxy-3-methylbut-2-enyl-diphosphate synthase [Candidatus Bipolaricaulota bacterium]
MKRDRSIVVDVGGVKIGGDNPVVVQSMTNTPTEEVEATLDQVERLVERGCELVRVAVPDSEAGEALPEIVDRSPVPIIADIHYSPDLAFMALEAGVDKLRLNPGNITDPEAIGDIAREASARLVPIRVGVNSGSLGKDILERYGRTPEAMVLSAEKEIELLENQGFDQIVVSLKSSEVNRTIEANEIFSRRYDYPLHLGVTEAGGGRIGVVKSAIGIGILLQEGIGDTIRVSLTGDPAEEVVVAYDILKSLGIRNRGVDFVSCPTCGRTEIDVGTIGRELEQRLADLEDPVRVSLMGCSVNGIGEADSSDVGLVGTAGGGVLYVEGEQKGLISTSDIETVVNRMEEEIRSCNEKGE